MTGDPSIFEREKEARLAEFLTGKARTFRGMGPTGKPEVFTFPEGRWYQNVCPDCGKSNGGGIETDKHKADDMASDPYSPLCVPCIWCKKGPMVVQFVDGK